MRTKVWVDTVGTWGRAGGAALMSLCLLCALGGCWCSPPAYWCFIVFPFTNSVADTERPASCFPFSAFFFFAFCICSFLSCDTPYHILVHCNSFAFFFFLAPVLFPAISKISTTFFLLPHTSFSTLTCIPYSRGTCLPYIFRLLWEPRHTGTYCFTFPILF